jgi:hypothetical protein
MPLMDDPWKLGPLPLPCAFPRHYALSPLHMKLPIAGCFSFSFGFGSFGFLVRSLQFAVCVCLLLARCRLRLQCLQFAVCCLLFVVYGLPFAVYFLPLLPTETLRALHTSARAHTPHHASCLTIKRGRGVCGGY